MRTLVAGELPAFAPETAGVRAGDWTVAGEIADADGPTRILTGLDGYADASAWLRQSQDAPDAVQMRVVVDTVFACFEAEEILFELRDFNVSRVGAPLGYLFSFIQLFADAPECIMPDRRDITPGTPCIDAYLRHLGGLCKRRGAQFETALRPVHRLFADERPVEPADLLQVPRGRITLTGMRQNIATVLQYLVHGGSGDDRIEAEFARAQLWQWVRHDTGVLDSGQIINRALFETLLHEARESLVADTADGPLDRAVELLFGITTSDDLVDALPDEGYPAAS